MAVEAGTLECKGATTPVQLLASKGVTRSIGLLAAKSNTGIVYVSGKAESSEEAKGFPLEAGQFLSLGEVHDVGRVYFNGAAGNKISYIVDRLCA